MKQKILLAEDADMIAFGLVYALEQEGYAVICAATVREAVTEIAAGGTAAAAYDLAIPDMQLPDGTGFDIRETLTPDMAVIFLTVVDDEGNIVKAFENGADDYITKPFRLRELLARVKAVLRRREGSRPNIATLGNVTIDTAAGKAQVCGRPVDLTALEHRLLLTFANNKGRILSRSQILESLWDNAGNFVEDNTLTVYIKRLREKLGGAATIETVRGLGYRAG
jgi:DNA-binding response OmpR family regulator